MSDEIESINEQLELLGRLGHADIVEGKIVTLVPEDETMKLMRLKCFELLRNARDSGELVECFLTAKGWVSELPVEQTTVLEDELETSYKLVNHQLELKRLINGYSFRATVFDYDAVPMAHYDDIDISVPDGNSILLVIYESNNTFDLDEEPKYIRLPLDNTGAVLASTPEEFGFTTLLKLNDGRSVLIKSLG